VKAFLLPMTPEELATYLEPRVARARPEHGIFRVNQSEPDGRLSQFGRTMTELRIGAIYALGPQAKGSHRPLDASGDLDTILACRSRFAVHARERSGGRRLANSPRVIAYGLQPIPPTTEPGTHGSEIRHGRVARTGWLKAPTRAPARAQSARDR